MYTYFIVLLLLLSGCSPSSLSEWRVEGVSIVRDLVEDFEKVQSLKDLESKKYTLKKKYNKLVSIMLEAEKYEIEEGSFQVESFYSDALRAQYLRIYEIEGAKELLYEIQKDSLHKLDRSVGRRSS